jgi:hypothetical protein
MIIEMRTYKTTPGMRSRFLEIFRSFCRRLPMRVLRLLVSVCSLALPLTAAAAVQLPNLFSDHAVLQRDRLVRIWGWGHAGKNVQFGIIAPRSGPAVLCVNLS